MTNGPRHILQLTVHEQKSFIDSFDLLFSDCDGVMWLLVEPLPLTGEAVNRLQVAGKRCIFVTNNNMRSEQEFLEVFKATGVNGLTMNEIMYPVRAMLSYLKQHKQGERIFSVSSPPANDTFRANGFEVETLEIPPCATTHILSELVSPTHKVGAVIFDINLNLTYGELVKAIQYLKDPNCALISSGSDRLLPMAADLIIPGFADFLDFIVRHSGREPVALGKPSPALGEILKQTYDVKEPKRCIFVGDAMVQDIIFGKRCGFQTLLVLSGATSREQMLAMEQEDQPDYYADSIADFLQLFKNLEEAKLI